MSSMNGSSSGLAEDQVTHADPGNTLRLNRKAKPESLSKRAHLKEIILGDRKRLPRPSSQLGDITEVANNKRLERVKSAAKFSPPRLKPVTGKLGRKISVNQDKVGTGKKASGKFLSVASSPRSSFNQSQPVPDAAVCTSNRTEFTR